MSGSRVALHDAVRGVAGQARTDQREQHGLGEHEPVRAFEQVLTHAVGVDHQAVDQAGHLRCRVVGDNACVREHDPFDRAVGDVSLVPEGDVLEACDEVPAQHPGET